MAKTKQIGVRFDEDLLKVVNLTPQKALNLYQESHIAFFKMCANDKLSRVVFGDAKIKKEEIEQSKELTTLASEQPKTLDELKKICPSNLTGIDRSAWISEHRVKYGL